MIPTKELPFTEAEEKRIGRKLSGILTLKYLSKQLKQELLDYHLLQSTYEEVVNFCKDNDFVGKSFSSEKVVYYREQGYKFYILPNGSLFFSEQLLAKLS